MTKAMKMTAERVAQLRKMIECANAEGISACSVHKDELAEMLNAVDVPGGNKRGDHGQPFSYWLRELELLSGCAYPARTIAWFRRNGYQRGLSPQAALDASANWGDL